MREVSEIDRERRRAKWWKGEKRRGTGSMMISPPDNGLMGSSVALRLLHISHPSFLVTQVFLGRTWHLGTNLTQSAAVHALFVCAAGNWHCLRGSRQDLRVRKGKTWTHAGFRKSLKCVTCRSSLCQAVGKWPVSQLPSSQTERWQWQLSCH